MADRAGGGHRRARREAAGDVRRAGAGGDRGARRAAAGGQHPGAPRPDGPPQDLVLGDGDKKKGIEGNQNKVVVEKKVLLTGSPFKSEYTTTKTNNKRLEMIYDDLHDLSNLIHGAPTREAAEEALKEYDTLLEEVKNIKQEIKKVSGMAIPMPKKLSKKPKFKP